MNNRMDKDNNTEQELDDNMIILEGIKKQLEFIQELKNKDWSKIELIVSYPGEEQQEFISLVSMPEILEEIENSLIYEQSLLTI